MSSKFIHVVANDKISFFLKAEEYIQKLRQESHYFKVCLGYIVRP
jgi:hypothetical protein